MKKNRKVLMGLVCLSVLVGLLALVQNTAQAQEELSMEEWNHQIRREKFDLILPWAMRERKIDMWIHVMRMAIPDNFGEEEFGSTSGVFVFTDRGGDRIERAILGRRWGATQRQRGDGDASVVDASGAYDIIGKSVFVKEPVASPMTEYDFRFKGLREFVKERDPKTIALNFKKDLGPWETYTDDHLWARAISRLHKRLFADLPAGVGSRTAELEG